MAYVPPHKRHLKTGDATSSQPLPSVPPDSSKVSRKKKNNPAYIRFYEVAKMRWFIVGLAENDNDDSIKLSAFTTLEPVATDSLKVKNFGLVLKENWEEEAGEFFSANPWIFIAEKVKDEFSVSLQEMKDLIKENEFKPYILVRFGKVLFKRNHSFGLEYTQGTLAESRRSFYTNVPSPYMQNITVDVVPKMGFEFLEEKEFYYVILSHTSQHGAKIGCKCDVTKDRNSLQLRKIDRYYVLHFGADMTCIFKNLDLRLALLSKSPSLSVTDEDLQNIKSLIGFATLDQEVKGGLKWPLGNRSLGGHNVIAIWHTKSRTFKNSSMKLKIRIADRYNFETSEGEVGREVILKLNNIISYLGEETTLDTEVTFEMLKQNMELIWKHFLL